MTISRVLIEFEVEEPVEPVKEPQPKPTHRPVPEQHRSEIGSKSYRTLSKRRYSREEDEWLLKRGNANKHSARAFKRNFGYKRTQKSLGNRLSRVRALVKQGDW